MQKLIFRPDDTLFFRDARPMGGASNGHGARFPQPHVLNSALHAAFHRAFAHSPEIGHTHARKSRRNQNKNLRPAQSIGSTNAERFGALRTVGPFPIDTDHRWYFPNPADLPQPTHGVALFPISNSGNPLPGRGSLPSGLYPIGSILPPSKDPIPQWLSQAAFEAYLKNETVAFEHFKYDQDFFSSEHTVGIGINSDTGTTGDGQIFSQSCMRFREGCALGAHIATNNSSGSDADLIERLFPEDGRIRLGGESRMCTVSHFQCLPNEPLPLPRGAAITGTRVKWVLLSPAIFPWLPPSARRDEPHPGGWLPSWIDPQSLAVALVTGCGAAKAKRLRLTPGTRIQAKLVAALTGRSEVVTGWTAVASPAAEALGETRSGAKSTHLAVPAGSIYYFEAENPEEARKLAEALNWHGKTNGTAIVNRRSTLLGEKGYGLGVCGNWEAFGK
jgi:CRISPR-associated protein Cmr3